MFLVGDVFLFKNLALTAMDRIKVPFHTKPSILALHVTCKQGGFQKT